MKIIVLGATGMLGNTVYSVLKDYPEFEVKGTAREKIDDFIYLDATEDINELATKLKNCDYIINCIGITKPYCHDNNMEEIKNAIMINALFPYTLEKIAQKNKFKVIQIATDCVYSGKIGKYREDSPHDALDVYGKTKSLGEIQSDLFLNVRSSIVGPEKYSKVFLLEWFLKQPKGAILNGFSNHLWNGITILQFAELCLAIIKENKFDFLNSISRMHHFVPNEVVNKYQLLCMFKEVFGKEVVINEQKGDGGVIDRTLDTKYDLISSFFPKSNIKSELIRLKSYMHR